MRRLLRFPDRGSSTVCHDRGTGACAWSQNGPTARTAAMPLSTGIALCRTIRSSAGLPNVLLPLRRPQAGRSGVRTLARIVKIAACRSQYSIFLYGTDGRVDDSTIELYIASCRTERTHNGPQCASFRLTGSCRIDTFCVHFNPAWVVRDWTGTIRRRLICIGAPHFLRSASQFVS